MSSLHLIRLSPYQTPIDERIVLVSKHDTVLLLDDGVYCLNNTTINKLLKACCNLMVIKEHIDARNLDVCDKVKIISANEVPQLTFKFKNVLTWQ